MLKNISLRSLSNLVFYINILDYLTDFWYITTSDFINSFIMKVAISSMCINSIGIVIFVIFGYCFDTYIKTQVFRSESFEKSEFIHELKNTVKVATQFVTKTALDIPNTKNKALYKTSVLMHVAFEAFPQLVMQGINNSRLNLWSTPIGMISASTSSLMIILAFLVAIKADKHNL